MSTTEATELARASSVHGHPMISADVLGTIYAFPHLPPPAFQDTVLVKEILAHVRDTIANNVKLENSIWSSGIAVALPIADDAATGDTVALRSTV